MRQLPGKCRQMCAQSKYCGLRATERPQSLSLRLSRKTSLVRYNAAPATSCTTNVLLDVSYVIVQNVEELREWLKERELVLCSHGGDASMRVIYTPPPCVFPRN